MYNHLDPANWSWSDRFYAFNGLSATVDRTDQVHLAFGGSFNYGDNFCCLAFTNLLIYHRVIDPDSFYTYSFGSEGSYTYRNFTDIATRGTDSIYLVYSDLSLFSLMMWESVDSGKTWTQDTILPVLVTAQSPTRIYGDSIYVAAYNTYSESLLLCRRHLGGGDWVIDAITSSQNHGQSLDGAVVETAGDTVGHLAFNDLLAMPFFYVA